MQVMVKPPFAEFIQRKLESGEFECADDVVSAGLRLLEQQDTGGDQDARRKIDEGWEQARSGHLRSPEDVRGNLAARKADWQRQASLK